MLSIFEFLILLHSQTVRESGDYSKQKLERPTRKDLRRESPFQMSVSNALIQFLLSSYSQKKRAFGLFFPGKFIIEPVR